MITITTLDERYSTTRIVTTCKPVSDGANAYKSKVESAVGGLKMKGHYKMSFTDINALIHLLPDKILSVYQSLPLISVITVVYNGEKYLEQTIKSVLNQTYPNIEYIIVDGNSTDGSINLIKQYEHAIDHWISEADNGVYDAMNKGIQLASGEFLIFLNADDFLTGDNVIESAVSLMKKEAYGYAGYVNMINEDGSLLYKKGTNNDDKYSYLMHQAFIYRKVLHEVVGLYDTTYMINADYDFYLRIIASGYRLLYGDLVLSNMRINGLSSSSGYISAAESLHIQLKNKLPVFKSLALFQIKLFKLFIMKVVRGLKFDFLVRFYRSNLKR